MKRVWDDSIQNILVFATNVCNFRGETSGMSDTIKTRVLLCSESSLPGYVDGRANRQHVHLATKEHDRSNGLLRDAELDVWSESTRSSEAVVCAGRSTPFKRASTFKTVRPVPPQSVRVPSQLRPQASILHKLVTVQTRRCRCQQQPRPRKSVLGSRFQAVHTSGRPELLRRQRQRRCRSRCGALCCATCVVVGRSSCRARCESPADSAFHAVFSYPESW